MRSKTRWALAGFMALVALAAPGTVGATAQADPPPNPFAGSWFGTWSVVDQEDGGAFDWSISNAGRITGTVTHPSVGGSGALVGHVSADGNLVFVGMAPSDTPGNSGFPFQGTAGIDDDGNLVVSARRVIAGAGAGIFAILTRGTN